MKEKLKGFLNKNYLYIIFSFCLISFFIILISIYINKILQNDIVIYDIIASYLINNSLTKIVKIITFLGGTITLISISILFVLIFKNKNYKILIPLNLLLITIFNLVLKNIVQRSRPDFISIVEDSYSFPSGHSMISMGFYGFLIYLLYISNYKYKKVLIILLSILILLIGFSRIYLGAHYVSDVLGGFLIAICYLIIFTRILKRYHLLNDKK